MKTRLFNVLVALVGIAAALGYKLDVTPEQISGIAGLVVTVAAAVNQLVHEFRDPPAAPPTQDPPK